MDGPADRPPRLFVVCTLLVLGATAFLFYRVGEPESIDFLLLLVSPLAGFGALALRAMRNRGFTFVMAVASGVYLVPLFMLVAAGSAANMGCGVVLLGWMVLGWLEVLGAGIVLWLNREVLE
jgi:hypothetical protein